MKKQNKMLKIKKCRVRFTPYQTQDTLQTLGWTKAVLRAAGGTEVNTIVYMVKGSGQSLLGLKDGEELGIIKINPKGHTDQQQMVRQLATYNKEQGAKTGIASGGHTQEQIMASMFETTARFPELFTGVGRAKVEPIHIYMDPSVKPIQQKQRKVALHFQQRLREHLDELQVAGVLLGLSSPRMQQVG